MTPTDLAPAVTAIANLGKEAARAAQQNRPAPPVLEVTGRGLTTRYVELKADGEFVSVAHEEVLPDTLQVRTLGGLVDFLGTLSEEARGKLLLHIESPVVVSLVGPLNEDEARPMFCRAAVADLAAHVLEKAIEQEAFMIATLARFRDGGDMVVLRQQAGTIQADKITTLADDGTTQLATASAGTRLGTVALRNPVELNPIRSFPEIDIGLCRFVFRATSTEGAKPRLSLFEADAGQWAATASEKIHAYLTEALAKAGIKVAGIIR